MISIESLVFGLFTSLAIFIGGLVALRLQSKIHALIAFCAGILIATVFLDIFPESIELIGTENLTLAFSLALITFLFFHFLDKVVFIHSHSHEEEHDEIIEQKVMPLSLISGAGILFHTFLDGLIIGTGFLVGDVTGYFIAIAILLHDFTDGISTVTIMLRHKQNKKAINLLLVSAGVFTIIGIILSQIINPSETYLGYLLSIFAGFFLYLGAVDLLPEAHKSRSSIRLVAFTILGAVIVAIFHAIL